MNAFKIAALTATVGISLSIGSLAHADPNAAKAPPVRAAAVAAPKPGPAAANPVKAQAKLPRFWKDPNFNPFDPDHTRPATTPRPSNAPKVNATPSPTKRSNIDPFDPGHPGNTGD